LLHYLEAKKLEAFFAALIATMAVCFFINFGYAAPGATDIAQGFIPYSQVYAAFLAVSGSGNYWSGHCSAQHLSTLRTRN
jgi:Mn2+/Fe2+ NRAMP family transporter